MYLQKIVAKKNTDPAFLEGRVIDWEDKLSDKLPPRISLSQSLREGAREGISIIAEMKRASPSKGRFPFKGSVQEQIRAYDRGGARAISVLTNGPFFQGKLSDLSEARESTKLPLLRKDFLTEIWEIPQAKHYGADSILLIAGILDERELNRMITKAHECDLEALLEIHDKEELSRVLNLNTAPDAIGINNRNLRSFEVDLDTTARLSERIPEEICRVSESGFAERPDILKYRATVDAFLIGEALMRSSTPEQTLQAWVKG